MNVVRLVNNFPRWEEIIYGLQSTFYHLSIQQARLGLNLHVICKRHPQQKKFEEIKGMNIHRVVAPYNISSLYKLLRLNKETKIDIIHTHATSGLSYTFLQKLLHKKWINAIHIAHVHGTTRGILHAMNKISQNITNRQPLKKLASQYLSILRETVIWKSADAVMTNSKFLKKELINLYGIPKEKIHVVYNGVDLQRFYPRNSRKTILKKHGLYPKSHLILYLGGFRPVKGPLYIIRAMEKIHNENKDIKVLFVGGKHPLDVHYQEAMMKLTRELRENGLIHIIENIPHIQLSDYYSAADVVVVPSIYDSFPKVILEAMACGTPVVASAVGGIPELIRNDETGVLVEPANPDKLAKAVIRVISDADSKELSSKARRLVEERFTWEHAAKSTLIIYKKLLKYNPR